MSSGRKSRIGPLAAGMAFLVIVAGYLGLRTFVAPHVADSVEVRVTNWDTSALLYAKKFNGPAAGSMQAYVNRTQSPPAPVNCELGALHPAYTYQLTFYWSGIVVESASATTIGCSTWDVSILGLGSGNRMYPPPDDAIFFNLRDLTGGTLPIPPAWEDR